MTLAPKWPSFFSMSCEMPGRPLGEDTMIASISLSVYQRPMRQIVIRNLDPAVIDALRRRAAISGTSMEEQARRALTKAVGIEREPALRRLTEIRRLIGRLEGPSILDDLRRDRYRHNG
jgi:plasmid stability protein